MEENSGTWIENTCNWHAVYFNQVVPYYTTYVCVTCSNSKSKMALHGSRPLKGTGSWLHPPSTLIGQALLDIAWNKVVKLPVYVTQVVEALTETNPNRKASPTLSTTLPPS